MTATTGREIRLRTRPMGAPTDDNFELATVPVLEPEDGQILVKNTWMSVDPYMRGRMSDRKSYVPPFEVGKALQGGAIGTVLKSRNKRINEGDVVSSMYGWRDYWVSDGKGVETVDPKLAPVQAYLGIMGMPGLTAYAGLLEVGKLKDGEAVFVSGAAGAVGSIVCQIAKIKGCTVVGSAGSPEKVKWLKEQAGIDHAFNYKDAPDLTDELRRGCPHGIDVYFENVGGPQLDAALANMRDFGRLIVCGLISQYNATSPEPGPKNFALLLPRRLRIEGFIVTDHVRLRPKFYEDMGRWLSEGRIKWHETVVEGLENAPKAFLGLFRGDNLGKMLVKIAPE